MSGYRQYNRLARLLAGKSPTSGTIGDVMAQKIYLSQIQAKIDRLQRERKQVLEHLELVDNKINSRCFRSDVSRSFD